MFPLNGFPDPCEHVRRCRQNEKLVSSGLVSGRVKCEHGAHCDYRFEQHYLDFLHWVYSLNSLFIYRTVQYIWLYNKMPSIQFVRLNLRIIGWISTLPNVHVHWWSPILKRCRRHLGIARLGGGGPNACPDGLGHCLHTTLKLPALMVNGHPALRDIQHWGTSSTDWHPAPIDIQHRWTPSPDWHPAPMDKNFINSGDNNTFFFSSF